MPEPVDICPWNANFETGIAIIDAQHQKLVGLLNRLVGHIAYQSDTTTLNAVFDQLRDYVEVHFTTEEAIWEHYLAEDAWGAQHRDAHTNFVDEVLRLKDEETSKPFETVLENIVRFLTRWLALHILEADRRMALTVQGLERGLTLDEAKQSADETMSGAMRTLIEAVLTMYDKLANRTVQMTREINLRRKVEQKLQLTHEALTRAKERAENMSEAKSSFLTNMSHEIRTPMGTILGMVDQMQQDELSPAQGQRLRHIEDAGHHLLSVINSILDLSKIEAGKLSLEEFTLDPRQVIDEAMAMLTHQAQAKGLSLRSEIDLPPTALIGDVTRLRQSLINYLTNAVKFTTHGGISLRCRLIEQDDESVCLRFEVEDTGPGLHAAELERLFEPFEQRHNTSMHRGTGLGLTITARLAELMGGKAGVESEPGHGSCFWFTARLRKASAAALAPAALDVHALRAALESRHANSSIVLAEDDLINASIAQAMLTRAGLFAHRAANGKEAIALAEHKAPALILMDMQMPVCDGLEATRQIRAQPWGQDVPIIALTANAFAEDRARCLEAGMNDFVTKPITPAVLYAKLLHWLDDNKASASASAN